MLMMYGVAQIMSPQDKKKAQREPQLSHLSGLDELMVALSLSGRGNVESLLFDCEEVLLQQ